MIFIYLPVHANSSQYRKIEREKMIEVNTMYKDNHINFNYKVARGWSKYVDNVLVLHNNTWLTKQQVQMWVDYKADLRTKLRYYMPINRVLSTSCWKLVNIRKHRIWSVITGSLPGNSRCLPLAVVIKTTTTSRRHPTISNHIQWFCPIISAPNCIKHFHWLIRLFWPIRFDVTIVSPLGTVVK